MTDTPTASKFTFSSDTLNHILMPRDVIQIHHTSLKLCGDIFYLNGVGFHSCFGYSRYLNNKLNGIDFISAFSGKAKEFGRFCKRYNRWRFLISIYNFIYFGMRLVDVWTICCPLA